MRRANSGFPSPEALCLRLPSAASTIPGWTADRVACVPAVRWAAFSTWASRRPSPCKANCSSTTSTLCSNGEASPATTATGGWRYPFMSVGIVRSVAVGCGILALGLIPSSDLMPPSATVAGRLTSMKKTRQAGFPSCVTPIRGWPCASAMSSPAAYR